MKRWILISFLSCALAAGLQIRLSHDTKKGYSYQITGPELEEVVEADQKLRQYLRSQAPKKPAAPAPLTAPKPVTPPTPTKK
jgi:hypothetical protein